MKKNVLLTVCFSIMILSGCSDYDPQSEVPVIRKESLDENNENYLSSLCWK